MSSAVLIQHIYPDTPGVKMLELTREHHAEYCQKHDIDYQPVIDDPTPHLDKHKGNWARVHLLNEALLKYDHVIWLDADTLIVDMNTDLMDAIQWGKVGVCWQRIPQLPQGHWNIGAMYICSTLEIKQFFAKWLESYPPSDGWLEQGIFNRMAHESNLVVTLSDRWNATLDVSMVPDAVVLGFHGQGGPEHRYRLMKKTMDKLFPTRKRETDAG